jgi:hypothetical protein
MAVRDLNEHSIAAEFTGSTNTILTLSIQLCPSDPTAPFKLCWRQFPIQIAFLMTTSKAHWQTLQLVAAYPPPPVAPHAQLCVAFCQCYLLDIVCCTYWTASTAYWNLYIGNVRLCISRRALKLQIYRYIRICWLRTYLLTYLFTPRSRVLLEKLTGMKLVKKFPAFYGTRRFITAFASARHLSLSWAGSIQSVPPHPTSWRSILILSSHLRLFPLPYALHAPPISFFLILSPAQYWVSSTDQIFVYEIFNCFYVRSIRTGVSTLL